MISINSLRIPSNYVLIKPDMDFKTYQFNGKETGIEIGNASYTNEQGQTYNPEIDEAKHYAVSGVVMGVPEKLIFNGETLNYYRRNKGNDISVMNDITRLRNESVQFDVPIEIKRGDTVYFEYTTHLEAEQQGRIIATEQGEMMFVKYDALVFKKCDTDMAMLNGFLLIEPLQKDTIIHDGVETLKEEGSSLLLKPVMNEGERYYKNKNKQLGRIVGTGSLCKSYLYFTDRHDDPRIKNGDVILFDPRHSRTLEYDYHRTVFGDKKMVRIQRKDIYAVLPESMLSDKMELSKLLN